MQRIIIHWTGGPHQPTGLDLHHYHFVIDGAGRVHPGRFAVAANQAPLMKGSYAAHTLNCNSGSIGIALAAMGGAQERPFRAGQTPITAAQLQSLVTLCRDLGQEYGIPVTPRTMLTHAEVQPNLGIAQRGKWDVTWLPGMERPVAPGLVGDRIRAMILAAIPTANPSPVQGGATSWIARLQALISGILSGNVRRLA
ncbi:N-acetylmuramoyl-L-alanine amidase [Xinfangfangia sp. D13-10-4-6]|uniref:peptidoglycan recognition protein family protein n=1 Tax=Pseudogemmobacter hezensis TaxID=2737662 RepID=UPI0015523497|nr:peptidoglycan recognition family protein [Pseudogemmobacter hezensis]NPD13715.1 N-acetylmuramoyl-L-alanine amidase [Pseudogemmobacter hezensis]